MKKKKAMHKLLPKNMWPSLGDSQLRPSASPSFRTEENSFFSPQMTATFSVIKKLVPGMVPIAEKAPTFFNASIFSPRRKLLKLTPGKGPNSRLQMVRLSVLCKIFHFLFVEGSSRQRRQFGVGERA